MNDVAVMERRSTLDLPAWGTSTAVDQERTNVHYELPARFFELVTGGKWNSYSCCLWRDGATLDEAVEAKLDCIARLGHIKPGARILDIGCGWAGPLTFLCARFGARGDGLTLSPAQQQFGAERAAREGVDATIHVCHWADFQPGAPYDVIYCEEAVNHFHDLLAWFRKCFEMLKPGGRLVYREVHFKRRCYDRSTPLSRHILAIFGDSARYRTLAEELSDLDAAGFELEQVESVPARHYALTIDAWITNTRRHRAELEELCGATYYRRFYKYLRASRVFVCCPIMTMDWVVATKEGEIER